MNQIFMAIHTFLFIPWSCIQNRSMCQHGPPFVGYMKDVAMAFLTLFIFKRCVCLLFLQGMIIFVHILCKMNVNIFDAVYCFGVKKIECVVRGRKVTIHAVCYKSLGIVDMGGCFPGVVCISNFVAGCAKLGCRSPDHGVITKTEKGKCNEYAEAHKGGGGNKFFHFTPSCP